MRKSGVLMHISSLPGNFGIGTLGNEAYKFVDFLNKAGQTYWQILPIHPTGYGDSPYQSTSVFAGNPYFIDLDILCKEGYLDSEEYKDINWGNDSCNVDYNQIYIERNKIFSRVYNHFKINIPDDFEDFCKENSFWLDDYVLFMAIKDEYNGVEYTKWDNDIKFRQPDALRKWQEKCSDKVTHYKMIQYFFCKQWYALKEYAKNNGVKIIGDIPIYVASDSSDVWAQPENFSVDKNLNPKFVAGCPPDNFAKTGQLWGNPVFNWDYMKKTGYSWWEKRLEHMTKVYDILRIDHFRGFESYYSIKAGAKDAIIGTWEKGPGIDLFNVVENEIGKLPIIAEDLGFMTDGVRKLLKDSGYPGMKILQFAFDSREDSDNLPHNYNKNCVVYTGTHDNNTILGWFDTVCDEDKQFAIDYLRLTKEEGYNWGMMKGALASAADTVILTMQDLLGLSGDARMNVPSTVGLNWKWRSDNNVFTDDLAIKLNKYTTVYRRI